MRRLLASVIITLGLAAPLFAQNPVTVNGFGGSVDTNSGNKSANTQRVVIATDQPSLSNAIPVSGTLAVTESGNWLIQGMVAHDAAVSGNPLLFGCYASASAPTDVSNDGDLVRAWCLKNGALSVNVTNSTLAATQSGTWTVQPGNTANTTAWLVTGTGGTFPATQSGNWSTRLQDGSGNAITSATRGSERAISMQLVDGSGNQITTFGGGTQYTEDAAAAADPVGNAVILVRKDTPATIASTDGDNVAQRGTNYGAAYVQVVTSSGSLVDSFGGSGGTAMTDDAAFTVGTTTLTPVGGTYKGTRDAVDDGDGGAFAMTAKRAVYASLETPNADSVMDDTADAVKSLWVNSSGTAITPITAATTNTAVQTVGPQLFCDASSATPSAVGADARSIAVWCDTVGRIRIDNSTIQGTAMDVNSGNKSAGTQRVILATDQPALAGVGAGATGAAPPANAVQIGGVTSGATGGLLSALPVCDSQGWLDMTTATTTEIAPLVSSRTIHVCYVLAMAGGTTTMTFKRGTGTNCGTGTTAVSPGFELTAQAGFSMGTGFGEVLGAAGAGTVGGATTSGNALCVTSSAGVNLHVLVRYAVY